MTAITGHAALLMLWARIGAALTRHTPNAAASDPTLASAWDRAAPEARAALLLLAAWGARDAAAPAADTPAGMYAAELHSYALQHTGTCTEFTGTNWPHMPLPGPAGRLASSLGFDYGDADISLLVVLQLTAAHPDMG
jgi:hypothetical protein